MIKKNKYIMLLLTLLFSVGCEQKKPLNTASDLKEQLPNIVFILADDLGYGDVEKFNPESKIPTPNLNKLAKDGISFTNAHAPSAVCTPTRYSFLTGRYPWRGESKNGVLWVWDSPIIKNETFTIGKMLQQKGYHTACIGKWHLGWHWPTIDGKPATLKNKGKNVDYTKLITGGPTEKGFDYYYGDDVPGFPPHAFIENNKTTQIPDQWYEMYPFLAGASERGWKYENLLAKTTDKAKAYIIERANEPTKTPFFLFFSMTAPHTPIAPSPKFLGKTKAGIYGDFVHEMDDSVGKIIKVLDSLKLSENTLIIFTSDNGSTTQDGKGYVGEIGSMMENYAHDGSGGLRGVKADAYEGGHRVPFIVKWTGKINPNINSTAKLQHTDMLHTFASLVDFQLPDSVAEDSFDVLSALMGISKKSDRPALITQSSKGVIAIQKDNYKLIMSSGSGGHWTKPFGEYPILTENRTEKIWKNVQLYDLDKDLKEIHNIAKINPRKVNELALLLGRYIVNGHSRPLHSKIKYKKDLWEQVEWVNYLKI
jgi:arylsulfatase A-like enzyme